MQTRAKAGGGGTHQCAVNLSAVGNLSCGSSDIRYCSELGQRHRPVSIGVGPEDNERRQSDRLLQHTLAALDSQDRGSS